MKTKENHSLWVSYIESDPYLLLEKLIGCKQNNLLLLAGQWLKLSVTKLFRFDIETLSESWLGKEHSNEEWPFLY